MGDSFHPKITNASLDPNHRRLKEAKLLHKLAYSICTCDELEFYADEMLIPYEIVRIWENEKEL